MGRDRHRELAGTEDAEARRRRRYCVDRLLRDATRHFKLGDVAAREAESMREELSTAIGRYTIASGD